MTDGLLEQFNAEKMPILLKYIQFKALDPLGHFCAE